MGNECFQAEPEDGNGRGQGCEGVSLGVEKRDRDAFRAEIDQVRRQGYAVMDEENELGMRAVAVPVLNPQGVAFASLATAVPVFRLSLEALVAHVPVLQEAAAELSARLPQR